MIASQLDFSRPLMMTVPDVLSRDECRDWIERIKALGPEPAPINTGFGTKVDPRVRNNRRVMLDDPASANTLLERIRDTAPEEIHGMRLSGVNERLRCYEYRAGQRFAPHSDGPFIRSAVERSWYTFMVYLNEEFEGGETIFYVEPMKSIKPRTGMVLLFQHPIIHEGSEVTKGRKYVVRTDLMYSRSTVF